ncbi:MAG TPA: Stp1/IreP family PP2C-type Ser/Thr phosphatase [Rhabdochlamydiaceae bacterium]|jgi:protein phosphatase|nr:Stp1/IreP family PP2C-type Ser/Thr phosphatase [Rhabdochlamydiaceae bacterium]
MNLMLPLIESFGISDIGTTRANNEDVWAELPDDYFYILADGMGGHLGGEVAAKESVLHICDALESFLRQHPYPSAASVKSHFKQSFTKANSWIRSLAHQHPDLSGMGTTLCCLLIVGTELVYANIGDSRIYRFRNTLERLTQDHSLREELLAQGELTEEAAANFPRKNILTRALGISSTIQPDIHHTTVQLSDVYFLCSDGLHDALNDRQMETILRQHTNIKEAAIELVEAAKKAGGTDNITILILKINL